MPSRTGDADMRMLRLMALAATAAVVPMAAAQTVPDPDPYYGIPDLHLKVPGAAAAAAAVAAATPAPAPAPAMRPLPAPPAGHSWSPPPAERQRHAARAAPPPIVAPPPVVRVPTVAVRNAPPPPAQMHRDGHDMDDDGHHMDHGAAPRRVEIRRERPAARGMPRHGRRFDHVRRIDRGGFVPHFWFGPQFMVRNWHGHGFPAPFAGGRWIRYYDDALLIDRHGRVHDGRYGWDWDRRGDRWGYDGRGVPYYVGDGDYEPDDWDYEWAERWERGEYRDEYAWGPPSGCERRCGPPPGWARGGHGGYGGYGGYAWGWAYTGPVVITETITTTAPVVEQVTTYEYVHEKARAAPRTRYRAAPTKTKARRIPVAPAHSGEKG